WVQFIPGSKGLIGAGVHASSPVAVLRVSGPVAC
ncbi:MAG: hypothetical protein RLY37_656, partial [Verrucomicrobiota bacterium]